MSQLFASGGQSIGSFSFSIRLSNEYSGLFSFRIDWFDLFPAQKTLKSLLPHHSSKASFLWCSAFFIVQLSFPYMTTGKTIALTRWAFVGKVIAWLFNMLSIPGFNPWVGKIPWRRERLPTPVFWPGDFHGLYNPWVRKE